MFKAYYIVIKTFISPSSNAIKLTLHQIMSIINMPPKEPNLIPNRSKIMLLKKYPSLPNPNLKIINKRSNNYEIGRLTHNDQINAQGIEN